MIDLPWNDRDMVVAVDTEGSGLHPDPPENARPSVIIISWCGPDGVGDGGKDIETRVLPFDQGKLDKDLGGGRGAQTGLFDEIDAGPNLDRADWGQVLLWLSEQRLVMHNAKHDLHQLAIGHRVWGRGLDLSQAVVWDTMLAGWLLWPLELKGLKETAERLWGIKERATEKALKKWLVRNKVDGRVRYDLAPWDLMEPYARGDGELTLRLFEHQQDVLSVEQPELWDAISDELAVMRTLFRMERRGIGYDLARSRRAGALGKAKLAEIDRALPFAPPTPDRARKWFFSECGALPHCVTPKKAIPGVGECCVRTLIAGGVAGAPEWAQRQKVAHAVSAYYDSFADGLGDDGRLRTDFQQAGTVSMRFSSQRFNLQALPHDYRLELVDGIETPRAMFVARDGCELWELDLSQAELRVATVMAPKGRMRELLDAGEDVHSATAEALFGRSDKEYRQIAKRSNFSFTFDVGPKTFQKDLEKQSGVRLTLGESETIVHDWRVLYPEFGRANRREELRATKRGFIELVDGRRRWLRPMEERHKCFNQRVQGSIAQFVKRWLVWTDGSEPGALVLTVHDSLVLELPGPDGAVRAQAVADWGAEAATDLFKIEMIVDVAPWHK